MDPLSLTGTLIAVIQITVSLISTCYDYRAGVTSASRVVLQISDALGSLKDVLESILRLVETASDTETSLVNVKLLAQDGGSLRDCLNELERLQQKLQPESGWRKVKKSLTWPLKEGETSRALAALERFKSTMLLAISADQATMSLALKDGVEDLTRSFELHTLDRKRQDIVNWLAAPDPVVNHNLNRKKRHGSTGNWFLASKSYEQWLHGRHRFLWLYGIPGCGKSVLSSTIIEQLLRYVQQDSSIGLAYFYFDSNDTPKRNIESALRSLITQLYLQSPTIPDALQKLYEIRHNSRHTIDEESFLAALQSMLQSFENVYLVLDALDECVDCDETLHFLHCLRNLGFPQLHILVTSRELPNIIESLSSIITDKLCLDSTRYNNDIHEYIEYTLHSDKVLSQLPSDVRSLIAFKLVRGEGGMFQWVVCQLEMLRHCLSVAAVRRALSTDLPGTLQETYDQILDKIPGNFQPEASIILQALLGTVAALRIDELVDILAINFSSSPPRFDPDSRLLDSRNILTLCPPLIITSTASTLDNYGRRRKTTTVLKFAHASVAEYLTSPKPSRLARFQLSMPSARSLLGQACLTYLMLPEFANFENRADVLRNLKRYPLLLYAVKYWPSYMGGGRKKPEDYQMHTDTKLLLQAFFLTSKMHNGGNFSFWVSLLIPEAEHRAIVRTQPLYYAASFGLLEAVHMLLDTDKNINIEAIGGRNDATPLHAAVYRDHTDVVKLLLARGANPNVVNGTDEPALFFAMLNGNHEITQMLHDHGASPLSPDLSAILARWWRRRGTFSLNKFDSDEDSDDVWYNAI